ncbi:MAG TPA: hypothetical protein VGF82_16050 [Terracidiphilus sp.]|jgi:hypothetical protein
MFCIATSISASTQSPIEAHACTLKDHQYQCDKNSFKQVLDATRSVSLEVPRLHAASLNHMERLARVLGKTVRTDSGLRLVLAPAESDGIYYGPTDRELGSIRAWYGNKLLWIESYNGQPDTPWPIVVNHLTEQFRHNFKR